MSGISGVQGVTTTTATYGAESAGYAYLSPDAMLAYCATQLQGIDDDIKAQMQKQQDALNQRKVCEQVQQLIESFGPGGPTSIEDMQKVTDALNNAIKTLGPNTAAGQSLQYLLDGIANQYKLVPDMMGPPGQWRGWSQPDKDAKPWQTAIDGMSNAIGDIKSAAEIDMLKLQDRVSQRQTTVQFVTNVTSKLDDTTMTVAKAV